MAEDFLAGHPLYRYVKPLSSGAFGVVVLYQHTRTNEFVAIKLIERNASNPKYVELEVLNHRWLKHPHVVRFRELFLTPTHICIVMEFANGGTLFRHVLAVGRLEESEARWFFQQLLIALDYCHQPGKAKPSIVNRDIKLENILLENVAGSLPLVKICDFGYSKNSFVSRPKTQVGTLGYMAPEMIRASGEKYDGEKADIWSCGVTLYAMLVGRYPFPQPKQGGGSRHTQEVVRRILSGDWQLPPEVADALSPDCQDLLSKLLQADPAQRISIPAIKQHPWFRCSLPRAALYLNAQCLDISDYSDVQTEADIKAILRQVQGASERVDDLIEAAIEEEQGPSETEDMDDQPDPYGLRQHYNQALCEPADDGWQREQSQQQLWSSPGGQEGGGSVTSRGT